MDWELGNSWGNDVERMWIINSGLKIINKINKYFSKQNGKRPQPNRAIVVCEGKDINKERK